MKSFSLSCEDAQDKDDWRLRTEIELAPFTSLNNRKDIQHVQATMDVSFLENGKTAV